MHNYKQYGRRRSFLTINMYVALSQVETYRTTSGVLQPAETKSSKLQITYIDSTNLSLIIFFQNIRKQCINS